jgi:RNA polymerase sigma-70 factor (ECF subfamily)
MMAADVMVERLSVTDRETLDAYPDSATAAFQQYGGRSVFPPETEIEALEGNGKPGGSRPGSCAEDELCRLMSEHERSLLLFTTSLLRDADLALDCVQDTFLRAYESLGRGRQVNQQWLFTVAYRRAVDEFRRRRRLRSGSEHVIVAPFDGSSETSMTVRQAMDGLTREHREALYLFAVAGFKTDEIAGLLGTTGPAVRQRLYRAREEFRRVYGGSQHG